MGEYNPSEIEPKWQAYWDQHKTFKVGAPGAKKFYCLDMFPYPSGDGLHVGHPLGYTATDIICRYKRMQGFSVLHPMGWDAYGLPAEQHAINTGEHPGIITEKNCNRFRSQLKAIGFSYDWDREVSTCLPDYYRWTQWAFIKLYESYFDEKERKAKPISQLAIPKEITERGEKAVQEYQANFRLVYYADAMVNWCPALGTVLANDEVIDGRSERGGHPVIQRPMRQWMIRITKYADRLLEDLALINWPEPIKEQQRNWIGKKTGCEITFGVKDSDAKIVAFTTRPDTLFGVTFFVISPEHPMADSVTKPEAKEKVDKYREAAKKMNEFERTIEKRKKTGVFTGSYIINPINNESVPLYIGDYVLMSFGTGAVMGVPAHDERDFEFARTFQIEIRPVIEPAEASTELTTAVIDGEIAWTAPGTMLSNAAPVFTELGLAGKSNTDAAEAITNWLEKRAAGKRVTTYRLRDWLFSRQRYWGEPIPVIHWEDGTASTLPESELPLLLPHVEDYKPADTGESPLAKATGWVNVVDPKTGRKGKRETHTMPGSAGSSWYFLRFCDPRNDKEPWNKELADKWLPVDLYLGGSEHAVGHLLYSRLWHKVFYDLGFTKHKEPFGRLFNQGMIQAYAYKNKRGALVPVDQVDDSGDAPVSTKDGEVLERIVAKMSKSLKNVVNPEEIIKQYGADTLRNYEMFMGPLDVSSPWDPKAITGNYRFLKRSWALVTDNRDSGIRDVVSGAAEPIEIKRALHKTIKKVTEDIEGLQFNTAIASMMEFMNAVGQQPIAKDTLEKFVLILSPFAPHLAEELWERLGHKKSLAYEPWPTVDPQFLKLDQVTVVVQVAGKKRATLEVPPEISDAELKKAVIDRLKDTDYKAKESDRFITVYQPGTSVPKLVNVIPG